MRLKSIDILIDGKTWSGFTDGIFHYVDRSGISYKTAQEFFVNIRRPAREWKDNECTQAVITK